MSSLTIYLDAVHSKDRCVGRVVVVVVVVVVITVVCLWVETTS
jgi:hypothetical protein